jgi:hypothetical protein
MNLDHLVIISGLLFMLNIQDNLSSITLLYASGREALKSYDEKSEQDELHVE